MAPFDGTLPTVFTLALITKAGMAITPKVPISNGSRTCSKF